MVSYQSGTRVSARKSFAEQATMTCMRQIGWPFNLTGVWGSYEEKVLDHGKDKSLVLVSNIRLVNSSNVVSSECEVSETDTQLAALCVVSIKGIDRARWTFVCRVDTNGHMLVQKEQHLSATDRSVAEARALQIINHKDFPQFAEQHLVSARIFAQSESSSMQALETAIDEFDKKHPYIPA